MANLQEPEIPQPQEVSREEIEDILGGHRDATSTRRRSSRNPFPNALHRYISTNGTTFSYKPQKEKIYKMDYLGKNKNLIVYTNDTELRDEALTNLFKDFNFEAIVIRNIEDQLDEEGFLSYPDNHDCLTIIKHTFGDSKYLNMDDLDSRINSLVNRSVNDGINTLVLEDAVIAKLGLGSTDSIISVDNYNKGDEFNIALGKNIYPVKLDRNIKYLVNKENIKRSSFKFTGHSKYYRSYEYCDISGNSIKVPTNFEEELILGDSFRNTIVIYSLINLLSKENTDLLKTLFKEPENEILAERNPWS